MSGYRSRVTETRGSQQTITQGMNILNEWQPAVTYTDPNRLVRRTTLTKWYDEPRRKKPKGFMPPTFYNMAYIEEVFGPSGAFAHCVNDFGRSKTWIQGCFPEGGAFALGGLSDYSQRATDQAARQVYKNLKGQNVNFGNAFAERKQTANLIAGTAKRLARAVDAARHRDIGELKRALGQDPKPTKRDRDALGRMGKLPPGGKDSGHRASELWLANEYGWKPLLMDVHGAAKHLAERDTADATRYRYTVRAKSSVVTSPGYWNHSPVSIGPISVVVHNNLHAESGCMFHLNYNLDNPALHEAAQLGLTNPAAIAWEVLPWSFVADWLLPIGEYVNAMDAQLGWSFLAGSRSERQIDKRQAYLTPDTNAIGESTPVIQASGSWEQQSKRVIRYPIGSPPELAPILSQIKNPLSTGHVLNAIALLKLQFK